ncbi:MAG: YtfJ family protein [Pseudomonadota bacterium]
MNMIRTVWMALLLQTMSVATAAQPPAVGDVLRPLVIDNAGILILDGEEVTHQAWSTASLSGRPVYLQHLAARVGLDQTYQAFSDALEARPYTPDDYQAVAVVNRDDAAFGTGFIVAQTLKSNKRRYPEANIVVDNESKMLEDWNLQPKSAAIMIVDAEGRVLFFKEGEMTEEESDSALALLDAAITANQRAETGQSPTCTEGGALPC